jgi:hypothetical protein
MARRPFACCAALAVALAFTPRSAQADPERRAASEYRLYAGVRHQSELFTANTLTGARLLLRDVDVLTELAVPDRSSPGALAARAAGLVFVDLPIVSYAIVVPHEAFGHATRNREFDGRPQIHFDLPLPYSWRADHYVVSRQTRNLYGGEISVASLGGLAAQESAQRVLVWTSFRAGTLRRGEALLYSATSLTHAAQTLAGADLEYAASLSQPLYRGDPATYRRTARAALVLDLVDPMFLYSLYTSAYRWLVRGNATTEAPALRRGGGRFFATSRTLPVPWGVEHQLHVLTAFPWASFDLGVRTGGGARESFGVELGTFDWKILEVLRVGGEVAIWTQPLVSSVATLGEPTVIALFGSGTDSVRERRSTGGAARILFEVDQPAWFLGTRLGWKSAGLWGERDLAAGFDVALTGGIKLD